MNNKKWWGEIFNDNYINIYKDVSDPISSAVQVSLIKKILGKDVNTVLDVGCGTGRHDFLLEKSGFTVTGIDYSNKMLNVAMEEKTKLNSSVNFIKMDMRNISFENKFDAVINMFTSFGYFNSEKDDLLVLNSIAKALCKNGKLILDLNNALYFYYSIHTKSKEQQNTQLEYEQDIKTTVGNLHEVVSMDIKNMLVKVKRLLKTEDGKKFKMDAYWSLYTYEKIETLLKKSGFKIENVYGSYTKEKFGHNSYRMILECIKKK